jgi:hypothetical protein
VRRGGASRDLGPQPVERPEQRVAVGVAERFASEPADPGLAGAIGANERVVHVQLGDSETVKRVQELLAAILLHAAPPFACGKPSPVDDPEEHACQSIESPRCYMPGPNLVP